MSTNNSLNHVALIMDGNGRWAKERGLARTEGHKEGFKRIPAILEEAVKLNIKCVTVFAFSAQNWNRPKDEIDFLFSYINDAFKNYIELAKKHKIRISVFGDYSKLGKVYAKTIDKAINVTSEFSDYCFNICLNYGSREEIVRAVKLIFDDANSGKININDLDTKTFENYLYTKDLPAIDLVIRTSGEKRLSNFLMYQAAYSELVFTDTYWPDFTKDEFDKCVLEYKTRDRRFGAIK